MTIGYLYGVVNIAAPGPLAAANHASRLLGSVLRAFFGVGTGGTGRIYGTVTVDGSVASRKVRLHDLLTGILVAEMWSATDGTYEFDYLDSTRQYYVIAHESVTTDNSAIMDRVIPA